MLTVMVGYLLLLMYLKMQKLVKAARDGTKDGLEKTKAAVKRGRSFIKTKTHCHGKSRTWTLVLFVHISQLITLVYLGSVMNWKHLRL